MTQGHTTIYQRTSFSVIVLDRPHPFRVTPSRLQASSYAIIISVCLVVSLLSGSSIGMCYIKRPPVETLECSGIVGVNIPVGGCYLTVLCDHPYSLFLYFCHCAVPTSSYLFDVFIGKYPISRVFWLVVNWTKLTLKIAITMCLVHSLHSW